MRKLKPQKDQAAISIDHEKFNSSAQAKGGGKEGFQESSTNCLSEQEREEKVEYLQIVWYERRTKVDFSAKDGYIYEQMERFARDKVTPLTAISRTTSLRMNQLTIADEVFNPFSQQTDSLDFYQVHNSLVSTDSTDYEHVFELDNKMKVSSRVRYSLWQALGDIGGFHDGLFMVVRFLLAPIAATFFHKDLLQKDLTETKLTKRER